MHKLSLIVVLKLKTRCRPNGT